MVLARVLRHVLSPPWRSRTAFPPATLQAIERAIQSSEASHRGQIRFAVETALELLPLLRGVTARERALEVFSALRVWDTEHNNGVLIYVLLADRDVEILADRGLHARLGAADLERICRAMEQAFRAGRFQEGVVAGIEALGSYLARHFPREAPGPNELPDQPVVL
jgi:uncharacterized membrane protein YgcG